MYSMTIIYNNTTYCIIYLNEVLRVDLKCSHYNKGMVTILPDGGKAKYGGKIVLL